MVRTGGELAFSLAAYPDKSWGTAETSAPPSFGAGSSPVTVNVPRPIVTIAPGHTGTVKLDVQRMVEGAGGYTITGASSDSGIGATPVSGQFGADGSAGVDVTITVAPSVPEEYYPMSLSATVGQSARRSMVLVVVTAEPDEP